MRISDWSSDVCSSDLVEILSDNDLDLILRSARSYNGYLDRPVTRVQIEAIYDLLKMGPTSANVQPARFVFCLSQDSREKLASVASEANAAKIRKAPAAVVVGLSMDFPRSEERRVGKECVSRC